MSFGFAQSDWVIVGGMTPEGQHMVMASSSLTYAEIKMAEEGFFRERLLSGAPLNDQRYLLTSEMNNMVFAFGPTYQVALANLFNSWAPDETNELPMAQSQITTGDHDG